MSASNSVSSQTVQVHPDTHHPNKAWEKLRVRQKVIKVKPMDINTPIYPDKIRFVCLSDTHATIEKIPFAVPDGDVLLHAGDITNVGLPHELERFNNFLGTLSHRYKVVIAGNHDLTFDQDKVKYDRSNLQRRFQIYKENFEDYMAAKNVSQVKELFTNCIYLEDQWTELFGIKIYGSPWQPEFCSWGFNLRRGQDSLNKWDKIPEDTDILVTHGPPIGHGDLCYGGYQAGCVELLTTIQQRVKPKYHVFGHIHEGYGVTSDGTTTYINASICTLQYKPTNPPIIFDVPLPAGMTKTSLDYCELPVPY